MTGESFQSLSFQYRISLNAVSHIVKGCCKAFVERMASTFVKVPSTKAEWLDKGYKGYKMNQLESVKLPDDGKCLMVKLPRMFFSGMMLSH